MRDMKSKTQCNMGNWNHNWLLNLTLKIHMIISQFRKRKLIYYLCITEAQYKLNRIKMEKGKKKFWVSILSKCKSKQKQTHLTFTTKTWLTMTNSCCLLGTSDAKAGQWEGHGNDMTLWQRWNYQKKWEIGIRVRSNLYLTFSFVVVSAFSFLSQSLSLSVVWMQRKRERERETCKRKRCLKIINISHLVK